jgi:hypothetical protein
MTTNNTSGTYDFNPSLGEIVLYAYQNIGIRPTAVLQEHMESARMATNMMLSRWSNQGVNLWAVELRTTPLIQGQATYDVNLNTVMILDAYTTTNSAIDRVIMPISRTEYASYPNKNQQGFPTSYWFDRLANSSPTQLNPTITLWPVPDGSSATILKYYVVRQVQDANLASGQQVEIPYRWMEAFADGLTYRLARIWTPQMAVPLKGQADESYQIAAEQDVEAVPTYISPMIGGYFR